MAPDQAFPSVSNGFNLEDLTASVNWCVWQGVLLMLFHSLQVPRGLIKGLKRLAGAASPHTGSQLCFS